jgi:hypothetical protein
VPAAGSSFGSFPLHRQMVCRGRVSPLGTIRRRVAWGSRRASRCLTTPCCAGSPLAGVVRILAYQATDLTRPVEFQTAAFRWRTFLKAQAYSPRELLPANLKLQRKTFRRSLSGTASRCQKVLTCTVILWGTPAVARSRCENRLAEKLAVDPPLDQWENRHARYPRRPKNWAAGCACGNRQW